MNNGKPAVAPVDDHVLLRNGLANLIRSFGEYAVLKMALDTVNHRGFYYSGMVTGKLVHTIHSQDEPEQQTCRPLVLNDRELEFLKMVCTEYTYKEIAEQMHLSPRTIDGYRDMLFEKLNVRTRVGLVLYAIRNRIVCI